MNSQKATLLLLVACCVNFVSCGSTRQLKPPPQPSPQPPALTISISPSSAPPGSPALTLTITGSDFDEGPVLSQVVWSVNGVDTLLSTSFLDSNHLTAIVPAPLLTSPVVAEVYVRRWDHIENVVVSRSPSAKFSIGNSALPFISSITPASVSARSPDLQVTIRGANLVPTIGHEYTAVGWYETGNSEVLLNATSMENHEVVAVIPARLMSIPATLSIIVEFRDYRDFLDDPPHGKSNSVAFAVN